MLAKIISFTVLVSASSVLFPVMVGSRLLIAMTSEDPEDFEDALDDLKEASSIIVDSIL